MSLQHGDKLFVFYDNDKIPKHGRYSYFGTDFGTVSGFSRQPIKFCVNNPSSNNKTVEYPHHKKPDFIERAFFHFSLLKSLADAQPWG